MDVRLDDTDPHEVMHVSWIPGTSQTQDFTVTLIANDGLDRRDVSVMTAIGDGDTPLNYTFTDLLAGQHYTVYVTAIGENKTASSLRWNVLTRKGNSFIDRLMLHFHVKGIGSCGLINVRKFIDFVALNIRRCLSIISC